MHERVKTHSVKSGIRTDAYRGRLRPERSALDHSAILTMNKGVIKMSRIADLFSEA